MPVPVRTLWSSAMVLPVRRVTLPSVMATPVAPANAPEDETVPIDAPSESRNEIALPVPTPVAAKVSTSLVEEASTMPALAELAPRADAVIAPEVCRIAPVALRRTTPEPAVMFWAMPSSPPDERTTLPLLVTTPVAPVKLPLDATAPTPTSSRSV